MRGISKRRNRVSEDSLRSAKERRKRRASLSSSVRTSSLSLGKKRKSPPHAGFFVRVRGTKIAPRPPNPLPEFLPQGAKPFERLNGSAHIFSQKKATPVGRL